MPHRLSYVKRLITLGAGFSRGNVRKGTAKAKRVRSHAARVLRLVWAAALNVLPGENAPGPAPGVM